MKKLIITGLALLPFFTLAETELKGSPQELKQFLHPEDKIIKISRSAKKIAYKDTAIVSLNVTTEAKKLAKALSDNSKLRADITEMLTSSGILLKNIKNAKFSTSPDYGWFGKKPSSYKVANTVAITITDEQAFQEIAKIVDQYKQITLNNTEYQHAKKEEVTQQVKQEALEKVLTEKEFYAEKLGVKLEAVSFSDRIDDNEVEMEGYRANFIQKISSSESMSKNNSFEKVAYRATVTVSFKVK